MWGELRRDLSAGAEGSLSRGRIQRFTVYLPSEPSIDSVIATTRRAGRASDPVRVETSPPGSEGELIRFMLLIQTLLLLVLVFLVGSLALRFRR